MKWKSIPSFIEEPTPHLSTEIIVPCKNKESHISACIQSLKTAHGSASITVVDDASNDRSAENIRQSLRVTDRLISISDSQGKKRALDHAIRQSHHEIILTTDADCIVSPEFITILSTALGSKQASLVLGPVFIANPKKYIEWFQQFDLLATMAATLVGHRYSYFFSGSGAHMGYFRQTYENLNPYHDNYHIASGDDIFFIEKILKSDLKTFFIKHPNSYVLTHAEQNWSSLWNQRKRWASKTKYYSHSGLKILWIFMGGILICFTLSLLPLLLQGNYVAIIFAWLIKGFVDYRLLRAIANFYTLKIPTIPFLFSLLVYPFFTVGIAIRSIFSKSDTW